MKARLTMTLRTVSAEEAQEHLRTIGEGLIASGLAEDYRFEIETPDGVVTEKCFLSEGKVIA